MEGQRLHVVLMVEFPQRMSAGACSWWFATRQMHAIFRVTDITTADNMQLSTRQQFLCGTQVYDIHSSSSNMVQPAYLTA